MILSYSGVQIILGQDDFGAIRPIEYIEKDDRNALVAVRLPFGLVLSGPVPSTSALVSTCMRAKTEGSLLADQVQSWTNLKHSEPTFNPTSARKRISELLASLIQQQSMMVQGTWLACSGLMTALNCLTIITQV